MSSIEVALIVDVITICSCLALLASRGGLRHSHPAVLYLAFHVLVVTTRAVAISLGAPTMFSTIRGLDGPSLDDIARAMHYADLALVAATWGWLGSWRAADQAKSANVRLEQGPTTQTDQGWALSGGRIWAVVVLITPIGLYAFSKYVYVPGFAETNVLEESFLVFAVTWPGLALILLIYRFGFRPYLVIPILAYLGAIGVQGYDRFRLILPIIFLCQIYLDRRGRRWPALSMLVILAAVAIIFIPLKSIGKQLRAGGGIDEAVAALRDSTPDSLQARAQDQAILDQLALTISLTDQHGRVFLGEPYLNVLLVPIPRSIWQDKPGLADYLKEISTATQPLGRAGGVTTLVGDLYLNFRLPGLVLIAFWLARLSGRMHARAYVADRLSLRRFQYLLLASILIQVFRDGLISLPIFLFVHYLPLTLVAVGFVHLQGTSAEIGGRPAPAWRRESGTLSAGLAPPSLAKNE